MDINEKTSDEEIVKVVTTSDQEAYRFIIERYQARLRRYVVRLIKDNDQATDIVQDSFIKAFINLKSFDTKMKFSSWIYRIAHNETLNFIKKHQREVPLPEDLDLESEENIEDAFEKKENSKKLEQCLKNVPLLYSEPLSLFFFENKSYEEISDILKIPMGTVAIRISRAKKIVKKICQQKTN